MAGINETFKEGGIVTKNDMRSVFCNQKVSLNV